MIIGLTGKYCTGKNSFLGIFKDYGFDVIDVDQLGHKALEAKKNEVVTHFGSQILNSDGTVNRKKLGKLVFSSYRQLSFLETLTHPWIFDKIQQQIQLNLSSHFVINAALLHKIKIDQFCKAVVWVQAPFFLRLQRALKRDRISLFHFLQRAWTQRHLAVKNSSKNVDTFFINNRINWKKSSNALKDVLKILGF